jgi:hypothetical protein
VTRPRRVKLCLSLGAPSDKYGNENSHKRELFVQVNGYKSHLIIPFATTIRGKREERERCKGAKVRPSLFVLSSFGSDSLHLDALGTSTARRDPRRTGRKREQPREGSLDEGESFVFPSHLLVVY